MLPKIELKELDPIIIYTAGKMGSSTVMRALQSVGIPAHRCYDGNIGDYYVPRESLVVTMVREPIIWSISYMFENADKYPNAEMILNWFQTNFRQATGFNVFGQRFLKGVGYKVYSKRLLLIRTDKLTEKLGEGLHELLSHNVVDAPMPEDFEVSHRADGATRHGEAYTEFVENYKLPTKYLREVYASEYFKQFFYMKEGQELVEQWRKR